MKLDLTIEEITVLSNIIDNFKSNGLHIIMSDSDIEFLDNISHKLYCILTL